MESQISQSLNSSELTKKVLQKIGIISKEDESLITTELAERATIDKRDTPKIARNMDAIRRNVNGLLGAAGKSPADLTEAELIEKISDVITILKPLT